MLWIGNGNISVRKHPLGPALYSYYTNFQVFFFSNWIPGELPHMINYAINRYRSPENSIFGFNLLPN